MTPVFPVSPANRFAEKLANMTGNPVSAASIDKSVVALRSALMTFARRRINSYDDSKTLRGVLTEGTHFFGAIPSGDSPRPMGWLFRLTSCERSTELPLDAQQETRVLAQRYFRASEPIPELRLVLLTPESTTEQVQDKMAMVIDEVARAAQTDSETCARYEHLYPLDVAGRLQPMVRSLDSFASEFAEGKKEDFWKAYLPSAAF